MDLLNLSEEKNILNKNKFYIKVREQVKVFTIHQTSIHHYRLITANNLD